MGPETQGKIDVNTQETKQQHKTSKSSATSTAATHSYKQRRNTEQRRPPKLTLDRFLVFLPKPVREILTPRKKQNSNSDLPESNKKDNNNDSAPPPTRQQQEPAVVTPSTSRKRRKKHPLGVRLEYSKGPVRRTSIEFSREQLQQSASRLDKEKEIDDYFGHGMEQIDNLSVFRCVLQNPNGINPHPDNLDFKLGLQACYDGCAAVIGLAETNVEWGHTRERENLYKSVRPFWDATSIAFSTSAQKFQNRYKPGGTMLAVCGGHWVSRIIEKGEDAGGLGSFTYQGFRGRKPNKVLTILFYRVCQQSPETAGEKTAWKQQYCLLQRLFPKETIDPRKQSVLNLQNFVVTKQAEGYDIILLTDSNENLSKKGSWCPLPVQDKAHVFSSEHDGSFLTLIKTCGLVDILTHRHPATQYPATYARGQHRIDGIFVSPRIVDSVIRTGMSPFYTYFVGDHRMLFVDFDANKLFGETSHKLVRPVGRGLQTKDPRKVERYNSNKLEQLNYHKIPKKLGVLFRHSEQGRWQQQHVIRYEKLDAHIVEIMRASEKLVTRRVSTKYDWSPVMVQAVYAMRYWKLVLRKLKGCKIKHTTIFNHHRLAALPQDLLQEFTFEDATEQLKGAIAHMYSLQSRHVELRQAYLEGLAEALVFKRFPSLRNDGESAFKSEQIEKQLSNLKNREDARRMYFNIGRVLNVNTGSVTHLDIPDATDLFDSAGNPYGDPKNPKEWRGRWRTVTDPQELEELIIETNTKQYNQAEQTPFGSGPLADLFGPDGTSQFALDFLAGEPIPQEVYTSLQPETKRLLEVLQQPCSMQLPAIPDITPKQFSTRYKLLDENTSSSVLSECHIGHYKASTEHPTLAWLHAMMMTLPYREGFSPQRWRDVVDVIIPKEEGNFKQHRMRIIRLCETDFNHSLAEMLVHPVGKFFEQYQLYPPTQYGSREGRLAVSAILNKVLSYDIVRLVKIVMTSVENDAIGCYDRIIQSIVALYLLKLGFPLASITSICKTFRLTKHFIRTAFGLSDATYESTDEEPLFGAGQGTTGGPIFWLLTFCLMYEAIDGDLEKQRFISACASFLSERYGDVFVDDSNLGITSTLPYDAALTLQENIELQTEKIKEDTAKLSQHYEKLLFATGGALNIKKCHWNLITWIWVDGVARMATVAEAPGTLALTSGYGDVREEVPRLEPTEGYRTLGAYIAPSGSMKTSLKVHRGISERFAGLLSQSTLNKVESYFAFTLYFCPKISYALPVTTYIQRECAKIQAPAMGAFLSKIGLNRHTARSIINGPSEYGGLGLPDFYTDQGIGQLRLLLGHMLAGDQTSDLIAIAMSYLQLIVGAKTQFFNLPYSKYAKWIERTWLTSIWQFLSMANMKLVVSKATPLDEQREGDSFLMTVFIYAKFSPSDLKQLNRCRLFHQVLTIADIATADGQTIDPAYFLSDINPHRKSRLIWPVQGQPSRAAWTIWRRALHFLVERGRLKQPLGRWKRKPYQTWHWRLDTQSYILYQQLPDGEWQSFLPLAASTTGTRADTKKRYFFDQGQQGVIPGGYLVLATPLFHKEDGDLFTVAWDVGPPPPEESAVGNVPPQLSQQSLSSADDGSDNLQETDVDSELLDAAQRFTSLFEDTADYFHRLIGPFAMPTAAVLHSIANQIKAHSLLACSDGSFSAHTKLGSHAYVFATAEGIPLLRGAGPVDGHPLLMTPYRTELGGITAVLYILQLVVRSTELVTGSATLFCDNETAVEVIFTDNPRRGIYPMLAADYDFISIARAMFQKMPIEVRGKWVKGHFSGNERQVEHDLNAMVDTMAGSFRKNPPRGYTPRAQSLTHPLQTAALISDGAIVTSKLKQTIYYNMFAHSLEKTIIRNTKWTPSYFQTVDWDAHGIVFRSFSRQKRIKLSKTIHGLWHTGAQKVLYGMDIEGLCPCCRQVKETVAHVYQCTEPTTVENRATLLTNLERDCERRRIPDPVIKVLLLGLQWFLNDPLGAPPTPLPLSIGIISPKEAIARSAFHAQTTLGWEQCLRGRLSKGWQRAILPHITGDKREDKAAVMVRWLLKYLLELSLNIWQFRNGILHGATKEEQRRRFTDMLHQQVREAFSYYREKPTIVSARNAYLFERQSMEQRLSGDNDAILGWLNTVEVAMTTYEIEQAEAARHAARFFSPFRRAGQQRLQRRQQDNQSLNLPSEDLCSDSAPIQQSQASVHSPSRKVLEQLDAEVPEYLRSALTRSTVDAFDLTDLFSDGKADNSLNSDSIPQPGPFFRTFLDNEFSTDQSSYCPSCRRDYPFIADSVTTSDHASICTRDYRLYHLHLRCANTSEATLGTSTLCSSPSPMEDTSTSTFTASSPASQRDAVLFSSDCSSETLASYPGCPNSSEEHPTGETSPSRCQMCFVNSRDRTIPPASANPGQPNEVSAMLTYLSRRGKGTHLLSHGTSMAAVTQEIPLRLSAETSGWLQQSSMSSDSDDTFGSSSQEIPFREQDDPPDNLESRLP